MKSHLRSSDGPKLLKTLEIPEAKSQRTTMEVKCQNLQNKCHCLHKKKTRRPLTSQETFRAREISCHEALTISKINSFSGTSIWSGAPELSVSRVTSSTIIKIAFKALEHWVKTSLTGQKWLLPNSHHAKMLYQGFEDLSNTRSKF